MDHLVATIKAVMLVVGFEVVQIEVGDMKIMLFLQQLTPLFIDRDSAP